MRAETRRQGTTSPLNLRGAEPSPGLVMTSIWGVVDVKACTKGRIVSHQAISAQKAGLSTLPCYFKKILRTSWSIDQCEGLLEGSGFTIYQLRVSRGSLSRSIAATHLESL